MRNSSNINEAYILAACTLILPTKVEEALLDIFTGTIGVYNKVICIWYAPSSVFKV